MSVRPTIEPIARERLRQKGQFWTPEWTARAMVADLLAIRPSVVFDPAVGEGVFLHTARRMAIEQNLPLRLAGRDVDPAPLMRSGLPAETLAGVDLADFVLDPPNELLPAIVANPPYLRHHRLEPRVKAALHRFAEGTTGTRLDGRVGYHVFFLVRALERLAPGGRLSFILPADTFEGLSAPGLWRWIAGRFRLRAVATFTPAATPFPGVDTNAVVVFIENAPPESVVPWLCVTVPGGLFEASVLSGFGENEGVLRDQRELPELLATGLSRARPQGTGDEARLGDVIRVMRGIATGDNAFFAMTRTQVTSRCLPESEFVRCIARTRHAPGDRLTAGDLERLDSDGQPTWLLSLGAEPPNDPTLQAYLQSGEEGGTAARPLISTRRPWWRMERREPPPFLFAYLGRRSQRFIRNEARALPLSNFFCIYPRPGISLEDAERVLNDSRTIAGLSRVGKSYGGGALKVEPRGLEATPIPREIVPLPTGTLF